MEYAKETGQSPALWHHQQCRTSSLTSRFPEHIYSCQCLYSSENPEFPLGLLWRNSTVLFMWSSSQNTLLLCYPRWLHKSGRLRKLRNKSSALQSDGCYMKCFQICMWNPSSSLHFPRPLMKNYKSASYPWLWNQGKVVNKFNICV